MATDFFGQNIKIIYSSKRLANSKG